MQSVIKLELSNILSFYSSLEAKTRNKHTLNTCYSYHHQVFH